MKQTRHLFDPSAHTRLNNARLRVDGTLAQYPDDLTHAYADCLHRMVDAMERPRATAVYAAPKRRFTPRLFERS